MRRTTRFVLPEMQWAAIALGLFAGLVAGRWGRSAGRCVGMGMGVYPAAAAGGWEPALAEVRAGTAEHDPGGGSVEGDRGARRGDRADHRPCAADRRLHQLPDAGRFRSSPAPGARCGGCWSWGRRPRSGQRARGPSQRPPRRRPHPVTRRPRPPPDHRRYRLPGPPPPHMSRSAASPLPLRLPRRTTLRNPARPSCRMYFEELRDASSDSTAGWGARLRSPGSRSRPGEVAANRASRQPRTNATSPRAAASVRYRRSRNIAGGRASRSASRMAPRPDRWASPDDDTDDLEAFGPQCGQRAVECERERPLLGGYRDRSTARGSAGLTCDAGSGT